MYYIGFPVTVRASFGMWGSYVSLHHHHLFLDYILYRTKAEKKSKKKWPVFSRSILAIIWFAIQGWWLGNFLDICFSCVFGSGWTNLPNHIPTSSGITTREMVAYFLGWLTQLPVCFIRPHRLVGFPRHLYG